MTKEARTELIKLFLIMKLHEAQLNERFKEENTLVAQMERETYDVNEFSSALDRLYSLGDALSSMVDVSTYLAAALGVEDITAADFGREFISIEDTMPDEKEEVFILFENGKICVSSWRYSKVRKGPHFAYEEIYGEAKGWLPLTESGV